MIRLVVYSSDATLQPLLRPTLGLGFQVAVDPDKDSLKRLIAADECDVVILDCDSRYCSIDERLKVLEEILDYDIPVVAMIDDDRRSTALELVQRGVYDYFRKPPVLPELKIIVRRAHEHATVKRELRNRRFEQKEESRGVATHERCDRLIGTSSASRAIYDLIARVANVQAHVLITGESGTGKELIARAIHNLSNRSDHPFVPVSCGAIPESLIESELFGHEKGAFTGSAGARAGYLEQAGGGTLMLDEIGELSLSTQVKLLRVLQEREFCRLGSSRPLPLRARVLFATHRDLATMVQQGTFRQDLYFRINVMRIHSPALRDRPDDIPLLAEHFLRRYSIIYDKPVDGFDENAMNLLVDYGWPGNVRELENVIQSGIIMAGRNTIRPEDLPEQIHQMSTLELDDGSHGSSFEDQLKDYRVKLAIKAVEEANGNKTVAARTLNISRAYLHRLIREGGGLSVM